MRSSGCNWLWRSFWILCSLRSHLHVKLPYVPCCLTGTVQVSRKPPFSLLSACSPRTASLSSTSASMWNSPQHPPALQELRGKQNLADVLVSEVPVAVSQLALLWPTGTWKWRNGKHLKGRIWFVFFLGEGFFLWWLKSFRPQPKDGIFWYKLPTILQK